jgi:hypothetical protein
MENRPMLLEGRVFPFNADHPWQPRVSAGRYRSVIPASYSVETPSILRYALTAKGFTSFIFFALASFLPRDPAFAFLAVFFVGIVSLLK